MSKRPLLQTSQDILEACRRILSYTDRIKIEEFKETTLISDAVLRNIVIIVEAVEDVSTDDRNHYSTIPWREMVNIKERLFCDYASVNLDLVWKFIQIDVPELEKSIREAIRQEHEE